jgi:hypothetical protein
VVDLICYVLCFFQIQNVELQEVAWLNAASRFGVHECEPSKLQKGFSSPVAFLVLGSTILDAPQSLKFPDNETWKGTARGEVGTNCI